MKNTIKKQIANYILDSLPEYNSKDAMNVKLIKGKPFTLEQLVNALRKFDTQRGAKYFDITSDHRKYQTETYGNFFAADLIRKLADPKGYYYNRNREESLQMVLLCLNKELHKKIVDIKVQQCVQNRLDHLQAIEKIKEERA